MATANIGNIRDPLYRQYPIKFVNFGPESAPRQTTAIV